MTDKDSLHEDFLSEETKIAAASSESRRSRLVSVASHLESMGRKVCPGLTQPSEPTISTDNLLKDIADDEIVAEIQEVPSEIARHYLAFNNYKWGGSTIKTYTTDVRQYLLYLDRRLNTTLKEADREHFDYYLRYLTHDGYRLNTISGKISVIRGLYRHLMGFFDEEFEMSYYWLDNLSADDVDEQVKKFEREALDTHELQQIVEHANSMRDRLVIRTLYQTAMRNLELRELRTGQLFLDANQPYVEVNDCKKEGFRPAPLTEELAMDLKHWLDIGRYQYSIYAGESEFVFPSKRGEKLTTGGSVTRIVQKPAQEAGLKEEMGTFADGRKKYNIDAHVLRHTGNTHWSKCDIPQKDRMIFAGHSSRETNDIYTDSDRQSQALARFGRRFNSAI